MSSNDDKLNGKDSRGKRLYMQFRDSRLAKVCGGPVVGLSRSRLAE